MRQRGDMLLIYTLNKIRVGNDDQSVDLVLNSKVISVSDSVLPSGALHIYAENALASPHNEEILNKVNGNLTTIKVIDIFPENIHCSKMDCTL